MVKFSKLLFFNFLISILLLLNVSNVVGMCSNRQNCKPLVYLSMMALAEGIASSKLTKEEALQKLPLDLHNVLNKIIALKRGRLVDCSESSQMAAIFGREYKFVPSFIQSFTDIFICRFFDPSKNFEELFVDSCYYGDADLVNFLLMGIGPNFSIENKIAINSKVTPLIASILGGRLNIFFNLLNAGADPNYIDELTGFSTIMFAVNCFNKLMVDKEKMMCMIQKLVAAGVDLNQVSKNGNTVLSLAIEHGNYNLVRLFLTHGANPNLDTKYGKPLCHARNVKQQIVNCDAILPNIKICIDDIIELLIKNGAVV